MRYLDKGITDDLVQIVSGQCQPEVVVGPSQQGRDRLSAVQVYVVRAKIDVLELHVLQEHPALYLYALAVEIAALLNHIKLWDRLFRLLGGFKFLVLFKYRVSRLQFCLMWLHLLLWEGQPPNLLKELYSLGGLEFALCKPEVLEGPVHLKHFREILNGILGDRVVAQVKHLEGLKRHRVQGVRLKYLGDLLHVLILDVVGSQKEHLELVVLMETKNVTQVSSLQLGERAILIRSLLFMQLILLTHCLHVVISIDGVPINEQVQHWARVLGHVFNQEVHLRVSESVIGEFESLHVRGSGEGEKENAHGVLVNAVLVEGDGSHFLSFMSAVFIDVHWGCFEGWMGLDIENPAESLSILVEFTLGFECLDIYRVSLNGFVLSERPNFLHFKFIIKIYNS